MVYELRMTILGSPHPFLLHPRHSFSVTRERHTWKICQLLSVSLSLGNLEYDIRDWRSDKAWVEESVDRMYAHELDFDSMGSEDIVVLTLPTVIDFPQTQPTASAMAFCGKLPGLLDSVECSNSVVGTLWNFEIYH